MSGLLAFSGIDGAGKSTQIALLEEELRRQRRRISVVWIRGGYTPLFSLVKRLARRARPRAIPAPGHNPRRAQAFESPVVRRVWLVAAILDLALLCGIWLRWRLLTSDFVICDRYLDDSLLDFRRNFPAETVENWLLWKMLRLIAPRPSTSFILLISVQESQRRSVLKKEPFPDSAETLAWRHAAYRQLGHAAGCRVLDCERPIDAVYAEIRGAVIR